MRQEEDSHFLYVEIANHDGLAILNEVDRSCQCIWSMHPAVHFSEMAEFDQLRLRMKQKVEAIPG